MTVVNDALTAGTGPLSANWATVSGMDPFVLGPSYAEPNNSSNDAGSLWTAATFSNDQYAKAVINDSSAGGSGDATGAGVMVRATVASTTCYRVVVHLAATGNTSLQKLVAGVFTELKSGTAAWAVTDTVELRVVGTALTVWRNGTQLTAMNTTDSSIASGKPGLAYSSSLSSARLVTFEGGDLAGGGTSYSLSVTAMSVAVVGKTVNLNVNRHMAVTAMSVPVVGKTVNLNIARHMSVTTLSVPVVGESVTLTYTPAGPTVYHLVAGTMLVPIIMAPAFAGYGMGVLPMMVPVVGQTVTLTYTPAVPGANYSLAVTRMLVPVVGKTVNLTWSGAPVSSGSADYLLRRRRRH